MSRTVLRRKPTTHRKAAFRRRGGVLQRCCADCRKWLPFDHLHFGRNKWCTRCHTCEVVRQSRRACPGVIYFMEVVSVADGHRLKLRLIKIGYATDVERRRRELDTAQLKHKILATLPGTFQTEARLHVVFSADGYDGEYFWRTPRLMRWINRYANKYRKANRRR